MASPRVPESGEAPSVESLLAAIASGDTEALAALYRQQQRNVLRFILQIIKSQPDAEEVLTDTFLHVWRNAAQFSGQSKATTWILGIARHKALDRARLRKLPEQDNPDWDSLADIVDNNEPSSIERIASKEISAKVLAGIAALPAEQRQCLHLVFFEDMSVEDVALIQGVPKNTVKTRLHYARNKLRVLLANEEVNTALTAQVVDHIQALVSNKPA
ncbi:MAG: sigma-70 family RNA polymerase sigma factor [Betaproteobacteria bacterium]|nr:sigma-70 family RNA polymerase sigma factor [Betaproteobacteria bacterium]